MYQWLVQNAQRQPDGVGLVDERGAFTWRQLAEGALRVCELARGATKRPAIGVLLPSGSTFYHCYFGCLMAGKTVVPINFLLGQKELAHIISDSGIDVILSAGPLVEKFAGLPCRIIDVAAAELPAAGAVTTVGPTAGPNPDDVAVLLYTSGTSALPKGVMLTYGNFMSDADACIERAKLRRKHVFLAVLPMFHAFGMTTAMIAPTRLGSPIVCIGRFSPMAALEAIRKNQVSVLFAVPSILATLVQAKSARPEDFAQMDYIISGGEPLPPQLVVAFQQRFGKAIYEGYGLTETSPVLCLNTPESCRPGSVGQGIPGTEFRLVDDDGRPVSEGQIGEILVRGPMVMKGYHNLPEVTSQVLTEDGFFRTGDLGRLDGDGFLFVTGRKKDMIIVSGEKVYPREIEDLLTKHPDVEEAAVVGVKSEKRGEMVVAYIRSREGVAAKVEELRTFCQKSGIPAWKCPREYRVVESFPRSPTGKILKRELQAMFVAAVEAGDTAE